MEDNLFLLTPACYLAFVRNGFEMKSHIQTKLLQGDITLLLNFDEPRETEMDNRKQMENKTK